MKKSSLFFLVVVALLGFAGVAIFSGCVGGNPSSVEDNQGFSISAGIVPAGSDDTVFCDTFLIGQTIIFRVIDEDDKAGSVQSCTWDYGDDSDADDFLGLSNGIHSYSSKGEYDVKLYIYMKSGEILSFGIGVAIVKEKGEAKETSKDSLFKFISSERIEGDVWKWTWGSLLSAFKSGDNFQIGYDDWDKEILLKNQLKSSNKRLALVTVELEAGKTYDVGLGDDWNGTLDNSVWLTPSRQAGNKFYNSDKKIMSFFAGFNGAVYPIDSIPSDSGRGDTSSTEEEVDTLPGVYGDVGESWRLRFTDRIHSPSGGKDSVVLFCNLKELGCEASSAEFKSNAINHESINLTIPSGKTYGYCVIAAADIPEDDGLIGNYSRGDCQFTGEDNESSIFWGYEVNGEIVAFQMIWVPYSVSLPKVMARAVLGCMRMK